MFDERNGRFGCGRATRRKKTARRGVVLLIVSIVVAMLTLGGATLLLLMKTEREATTTRGQEALVKSVDRSAVVFLLGTLESSRDEREKIGGVYDNPNYFCAAPLLTIEEGGDETSRFTVLSPKFEKDKIEGVRYGLVDESTRLNLSAVLDWDAQSPGAGRAALMKLPGMTAIAADSILDWIDPDEKARANGGEANYYSKEKLPYSPRNAVPVFLEEILLAHGVTRLQLYGSDEDFTFGANKNAAESSGESALVGSLSSATTGTNSARGGAEAVPWKELLTVFSAEKDVDPKGEARVDLNVENLRFLYQELAPRVGEDLAKFAVWYRQYGPTNQEDAAGGNERNGNGGRNAAAQTRNAPTNQNAERTGSVASTEIDFSVPATVSFKTPLDLVGATVSVDGTLVESPIGPSRSKANVDKLFLFLDFASTSSSTTIVGRVNVNAAPTAVLAAIPGLATADVQKILDERPSLKEALPDDYRHAAWLYTKGVVGLEKMKELYSKTTAFGDVFRGQIVGFLDGANVSARADVVVDGTTNPPRQVFYKDLTMTGKGFSDAVLLGGTTTATDAANGTRVDGTQAAWDVVDAETGIVEIENADAFGNSARTSGYANPFAALDRETAATAATGKETGAGGTATAAATGRGENATLEQTAGIETGTADASATASAAAEPESRKERLLNALRSARETRKASNDAAAAKDANARETLERQTAERENSAAGGN